MSSKRHRHGVTRDRLSQSAPVFAALGDRTRLQLVSHLCVDGPMSITRLTRGARVTRQAVTKHLQVLASAGIVRSTRVGRESIWALQPDELEQARRALDAIAAQWDSALARLKRFVEA